MNSPIRLTVRRAIAIVTWLALANSNAMAQSVGLPAPRLLTTSPMGAQVGTEVEVTITGGDINRIKPGGFYTGWHHKGRIRRFTRKGHHIQNIVNGTVL